MAEVAAARIAALLPIVGEFDLTSLVTRHAEEDQRELPLRHVVAPPLLESEQLKKSNSGAGIGDSDHRMQEFHFVSLNSSL